MGRALGEARGRLEEEGEVVAALRAQVGLWGGGAARLFWGGGLRAC
jgi:hypothetical protein